MEDKEKEKSVDKSIDERVHQQLVYKDNRIIDLNNVILDKERQILDLQERVREHNEVATVKNQAMRIVQQKFEEMHRDKKDMSTETEPSLAGPSTSSSVRSERRTRSSSPGHVIAARKTIAPSSGTFSPPPIDPPVEFSSKLGANLPDIDGISRKHQRKRVTFDLNPGAARHQHNSDALESALTEASSENALLRQQVFELNSAVEKMKSDYEAEIVKCTKETKTAGLKARVAATARIKELETSLEAINRKFEDETDRLGEEVSTLRSSRNWEIEQNAQLRDQVAHLKEKAHKLTEELDVSEKAKRTLDTEVEDSKKLMELMVDDLLQAENAINYHVNQKEAIFQDVDRLKEAIVAQDRFIEILEADIVIYEQHIGLLRESLGASKIDHRALIKSKAFETKLLALEREKEQSDKKSNEDRLKTKALDKKCRVLVEQNEQLMARLCELEMSSEGADESRHQRIAEQDERIRQVTSALESERDVSQRLRETKEALERELVARSRQEEASSNRHRIDVEMSKMEAENKVDEMTVEVEAARKKVADVLAEVEQLRAANFDLQMHIETAKRTMEELADSNEELEERVKEVEEACEEKEEDLKQSTWDVEQLTRQNEALRVELDGVRQGFQETRELSEEVTQLKSELERQQELHRAQFEAACERLEQEEKEEEARRKSSLEVQQEQYILAYEQRIREMKDAMDGLRLQLEQKETELVKLRDEVTPVQRKTTALLEAPVIQEVVEKKEVQMVTSAPAGPSESDELAEKLERLEMENKLSGELNVELGRAMLDLQEQNELLRKEREAVSADEVATGRELELHVMMVNEMTEQIVSMQARIDEMHAERETKQAEVDKLKMEVTSSNHNYQRANSEMERLLHNLAEFEIARKDDLDAAASEHDVEIRAMSIKLEDARRDIADLEAKLQEAQTRVVERPPPVPVQETVILKSSTPETSEQTTVASDEDTIREQNRLFRECHDGVSRDMLKLIELKDELEIAVQALKAEIWTLNSQLKSSILDRESLEDRVCELDALVEKEKKRAISLDVELQEQVDLTNRAVRRAAEAENESNQRMAECLEKETRREEVEMAYHRLNEYYNQLQEAYNNVYAQLASAQTSSNTSEPSTSSTSTISATSAIENVDPIVDGIMTILLIARDPSVSFSTQQKLEKVAEKLKALLGEFDENQKALEEQRRISEALEKRLETLEHAAGATDEVTTTRERVEQLEGEIEWKEEECAALKRRIGELEKALEAVAERADESEAARLTTRQADVDSLFRTNAELAHTNVRLQNEVDEAEETRGRMEEEKLQLEEHVKRLEEQVAELVKQQQETRQPPAEFEEKVNEVERLASIEKILNNRILALEDQNTELEEKVQEIEDELMTVKKEGTSQKKSDEWDDWGEKNEEKGNEELDEAKNEVERLTEVEKALTMRVEMLQMHNQQLEAKIQKKGETPVQSRNDEDWGWGEEKQDDKTAEPEKQEEDWGWGEEEQQKEQPVDNSELLTAKSEIERLSHIEKVLNNRILALEDQNIELEERLQEMEEELNEQKKSSSEKKEDDWGGWGEEEKVEKKDDSAALELQKTIEELQERLRYQKEVIEKAEAELIEQQDRYDELEESYEQAKQADGRNEELAKELEQLKVQLEAARRELEEKEAERLVLEERVKDLETNKKEDDGGWNDNGWGDDEKEEVEQKDSEELIKLRESHAQLLERINQLEEENDAHFAEKEQTNSEKKLVEQQLKSALAELEDVKTQLAAKETESSSEWNDDGWNDDGELDKMKETQKVLEMRVEALQQELHSVTEREIELTEVNQELRDTLKAVQTELVETKQKLSEVEATGWGNDDGWNNDEEDEVKKQLEAELEKRNETVEKLREQIAELQRELLQASESADLTALEELEQLKEELRVVSEQNGLLKDSEARLLDHADEFAIQMDKYREKCSVLTARIAELEAKLAKVDREDVQLRQSSDELVTLRQQLAVAEEELKSRNATISDREGLIVDLRRQIAEQTKIVEDLRLKLKTIAAARRSARPQTSSISSTAPPQSSRPSSRMSTSSRISTASSFVPEAVSVPLQSAGSAFDVVVPQNGEPLRRRNK